MSGRMRAGAFLRALRLLVPEADLNIIHERPWHSLTFGGTHYDQRGNDVWVAAIGHVGGA